MIDKAGQNISMDVLLRLFWIGDGVDGTIKCTLVMCGNDKSYSREIIKLTVPTPYLAENPEETYWRNPTK